MGWTPPVDTRATGYTVTATDWDTVQDNLAFLYGDTSWTAPTFANSWVNDTNYTCGFRKVGTRVVFRGRMKSGTIGQTAFTLPAGYLPTTDADCSFACDSNGAYGRLAVIAGSGLVIPEVGSNLYFSLEGVTFDTLA